MSHFESTQASLEKIVDLVDDDGFIHPRFHQLQAKTGRITTTRPAPFDKLLRPIVVPSRDTFGICEYDIAQAEAWLIACLSGDIAFQKICESYDVYLRLGVDVMRSEFEEEDARLIVEGPKSNDDESKLKYFKEQKYHSLRNSLLKALILAIIYGQSPRSVAKKTKQKESLIHKIFLQLEKSYPDLFAFIYNCIKCGSHRGYIELKGGFRIHVSGAKNEINRLRNNPVQGMCAVLFNKALLLCFEFLSKYGGRILLPLYDAIVIEAPVECLQACHDMVQMVFTSVFQGAFPEAIAKVKIDINDKDVRCWNKDGISDSVEDIPVKRKKIEKQPTQKSPING